MPSIYSFTIKLSSTSGYFCINVDTGMDLIGEKLRTRFSG
jgi:hypothetical protein